MSINSSTDGTFVPRNIRRFPSELQHVPSRDAGQAAAVGRRQNYAEVVAAVEDTNGRTSAASVPAAMPAAPGSKPFSLWEREGFGFSDLVDMINPLHHIPVVATVYRNLSGDQIGAAPRVVGGAIWGRIGGFVGGLVNAAVEWWTGKDIGDHVYAAVFGDPKKNEGTAVAQKVAPIPDAVTAPVATAGAPASSERIMNSADAPFDVHSKSREIISTAPRHDMWANLASPAYVARTSYERHRRQGEPGESLGIRLPV
jgi:hypothetical protein